MVAWSEQVRSRAGGRCEYCCAPQAAFRRRFHIEHIVARQHGGPTQLDNLALACWHCNLKKGPNLTGIDPDTGQIAELFHPRKDRWIGHFDMGMGTLRPLCIEVQGLTPIGRATVRVLGLNEDMQQMLRYEFWSEGLYELADS
jgi:hypothetical protein